MVSWRASNQDRIPCSTWLAGHYNRNYGALVSSGTAAIELALLHLGIRPGWKVAIPSTTCLQVPSAVLRCGGIPIIIDTYNELVLTTNNIAALAESPDAIIAIHQWGLHCDINALKNATENNIPIIEDSSHAWGLNASNITGHKAADVIVTSMGEGKALDLGGGGAAFADTRIDQLIDTWSPRHNYREVPAYAVSLSMHAFPHIAKAVAKAKQRVHQLQQLLPSLMQQLDELAISYGTNADNHTLCCKYLPVHLKTKQQFTLLRNAPEAVPLGVCAPVTLDIYPMLKNYPIVNSAKQMGYWLLLDPIAASNQPALLQRWVNRIQKPS